VDKHEAQRLFTTRPIAKIPISDEDLRRAAGQAAQLRRARRVEGTFDFTESVNEAVIRTLPPKERGGTIVFAADADVGAGLLSFTVAWLMSLYNQFKQSSRVTKAEEALKGAGFPFGTILSHRFRGRYRSPTGNWFTEKSLTLQVLFVPKKEILKLAAALAQGLKGPVLVKFEANGQGQVYFVNADCVEVAH
jgi:hypothetical protein